MKINYVIATYNGECNRRHSHPLPKDVLRTHLEKLKASMQAIDQVTIMMAESPNHYKDYYDVSKISSQFTIPVEMIECENYGYSPGQWLKAYELFRDKFDYYIFMEDDYCPGIHGFDDYLIRLYKRLFPGEIGLMCSLVEGSRNYKEKGGYPIHFEGGVVLSTQTLNHFYSAWLKRPGNIGPREQLDKITSKESPGHNWERHRLSYMGGYYQLTFSHLFTMVGIEHEDYLHIDYKGGLLQMPYWADKSGGEGRIWFYNKGDKRRDDYTEEQIYRSPIIPIQLSTPSFIEHHTPFSAPSIQAARLKLCRSPHTLAEVAAAAEVENDTRLQSELGDPEKKVIFIIGMHRTGSSLLSRCLVDNGFSIGVSINKDKDWQNPHGYCENDMFTRFHDRLLQSNNSAWHTYSRTKMSYSRKDIEEYRTLLGKEFRNQNRLLIKDPRLTPFTDFLKQVCSTSYRLYFIFLTREKRACCQSLSLAQNKDIKVVEELYDKTHLLRQNVPECLMINHNDILYHHTTVMRKTAKFCGVSLSVDTSDLVDPKLHRVKTNA
jgi:hypothetical protein